MGLSLQDQLLKAGLTDKKKANQIKKQKHKQVKAQQKHKVAADNESKRLANEAREKQRLASQQSNQKLNEVAQHKALQAQIKQLIETNKQKQEGDVLLNFTDNNVVKRVYVTQELHKAVTAAKLAVVRDGDGYELVPTPIADKIAERDKSYIVYIADKSEVTKSSEEDDWYADFEIPDDLMW